MVGSMDATGGKGQEEVEGGVGGGVGGGGEDEPAVALDVGQTSFCEFHANKQVFCPKHRKPPSADPSSYATFSYSASDKARHMRVLVPSEESRLKGVVPTLATTGAVATWASPWSVSVQGKATKVRRTPVWGGGVCVVCDVCDVCVSGCVVCYSAISV